MSDEASFITLIWSSILLGIYHGINPSMGWPLAVSAGLMERNHSAILKALFLLAAGHFLAIFSTLLPFSLFTSLIEIEAQIRVAAGTIVLGMGVYLLINRKHPKILARIHPNRLMLWSFLAAIAHGAGLMLVPFFIGIDSMVMHHGHHMHRLNFTDDLVNTTFIALIHTLAMIISGGILAAVFYYYLGLKFLSRTWFNLDVFWALSLVCVGLFGMLSTH